MTERARRALLEAIGLLLLMPAAVVILLHHFFTTGLNTIGLAMVVATAITGIVMIGMVLIRGGRGERMW